MKILYGIQGTGHGHISRAREILPKLSISAEIEVLISGYNCNMTLEDRPVIQKRGLSLAYDSRGGVSYLQTALNLKPVTFLRDIRSVDTSHYDLVISDYEPVTAWASQNKSVPSVALSHQAAFLSGLSPRPKKKSLFAEQILKNFAPCRHAIGFHFQRYDSFIYPPIIRSEVLGLDVKNENHVTVYLPAFHHDVLKKIFVQIPSVEWHIFSPACKQSFSVENVHISPIGNQPFLKSMKSGLGVITSGGFETCAETMYLGKKLMVIPIKNQYEQLCNAAALKKMGVKVVKKINTKFVQHIEEWLESKDITTIREVTNIDELVNRLYTLADSKPFKSAILSERKPVVTNV
ncbi:MAG: hypothetical protein EA391_02465 [Balneolaceae bacterium]|nr:MAG: hypothetical protein EA391_02465 [Balneolaceae bacterium]